MIWSIDEGFINAHNTRNEKPGDKNKVFVTFTRARGRTADKSGVINLSTKLARRVNMPKYCVLGLSEDKNTLVIIPSMSGNMKVTPLGAGDNKYFGAIYIASFLKYNGLDPEDYPLGRYDATVEGDNVEGYKIYVNIGGKDNV